MKIIEMDDQIRAAGIPLRTVVQKGASVKAILADGASKAQIDQAAAIIASFDMSPTKPKEVDAVKSDVAKLTEEQFVAVLRRMTAEYLLAHPEAAKEVGIAVEEKI